MELLLIAICVVILVDLSGFIETIKHWIWDFTYKKKREYRDFDFRPFSCSFCMTHWVGLAYLLFTHITLLDYTYLLFLCVMTPVIKDILMLVRAFCNKIIDAFYDWYQL